MVSRQSLEESVPSDDLDASQCPTWCEREHLGTADDPRGFHHDGPVNAVPLDGCAAEGRPEYLFVNLSCREQRECGVEPTYVEIQDDFRTLARLTPAESVLLAQALLERAALLGEVDPSNAIRLGHVIAQYARTEERGSQPAQALFSLK